MDRDERLDGELSGSEEYKIAGKIQDMFIKN